MIKIYGSDALHAIKIIIVCCLIESDCLMKCIFLHLTQIHDHMQLALMNSKTFLEVFFYAMNILCVPITILKNRIQN